MTPLEVAEVLGGELQPEVCMHCWHLVGEHAVILSVVGNRAIAPTVVTDADGNKEFKGQLVKEKQGWPIYCHCSCHPASPLPRQAERPQALRQNRRPINGGKPKPVVPETPRQVAARKRAQAIEKARATDALRRHWKEERANSA